MKYVVLLGDGMSDEPIEELGGKTPLEHAETPNMDRLAREGECGLAHTVAEGFHPGSDVANLSVFGYDPALCYSGRSPLEAASMGIELAPEDVAFRLNLVTLTPNYGKLYMDDFSAGHITTEEANELVNCLQNELGGDEFNFYPGVSYRHLMVWKNGRDKLEFVPPHDISDQPIDGHLPKGDGADELISLMTSAQMLFSQHPVNTSRESERKLPANSIWLWGHGRAPRMEPMTERFGISGGAVISAVDLIKGIGIYAGLEVINVPGATGYIDTNYKGKADAALEALKQGDFVYLHVEAPDEAAHSGSLEDKLQAIESFDRDVVGRVLDGLPALGDFRVVVLPDHPTPVERKTHTADPVPFAMFSSDGSISGSSRSYSESEAAASGLVVNPGHLLMSRLIGR
ncbi:MAG: cofactor-independent phosphoglycerate mutase [Desulfuromonas sp.]|nr:MAG: cofactor-independent phosphoglycerate mutase [Desulfuromonas sp.]